MSSVVPFDEAARLEALNRYEHIESEADPLFDNLATVAAAVCHASIAQIGLMDRDYLWIKSDVGPANGRIPRRTSFGPYAICKRGETVVVPDIRQDSRFAGNPMLSYDPPVRFFAAVPLIEPTGHTIGTLVVVDNRPRSLSVAQQSMLNALANHAVTLLELQQDVRRLQGEISERSNYERRTAEWQHQLVAINAALCVESSTDSLTGLANRRAFDQQLEAEIQRAHRLLYPLSLLMIDIDHFKGINDAFGHPAGDQVIRQVAANIRHALRTTDYAARIGGDEFVAILPGTDLHGARVIAERCRLGLEAHPWRQQPVHISVGIGQLSPGSLDGSALVEDADRSLLRAKELGRNQVAHANGLAYAIRTGTTG